MPPWLPRHRRAYPLLVRIGRLECSTTRNGCTPSAETAVRFQPFCVYGVARFARTTLAEATVRFRPFYTADAYLSGRGPTDLRAWLRLFDRLSYPIWQQLEEVVRSGQAQTRHGHFTEEEQRIFSEGVEEFTAGPARALANTFDFSQCHGADYAEFPANGVDAPFSRSLMPSSHSA